ncbi:MAG: glycosyltransferase family 87 protein [Planctomycetota bacterium]
MITWRPRTLGHELLIVLVISAPIVAAAAYRARGWQAGGSDFDDFHRTVRHGLFEAPYATMPTEFGVFNYHPFFMVLMGPFGLLPMPVAAAVFVLLSIALLYLAIRAALIELAPGLPLTRLRIGALSVGLVAPYLIQSLLLGQFEAFVLALLVFAWLGLEQRSDYGAGALLAIAVLLKAFPGLLLVWLVLKRRWRALNSALAGIVIGGLVLPALMLGPRHSWELQEDWFKRVVVQHSALQELVRTDDFMWRHSIEGLPITLRRYLTPQPYLENQPDATINFVSLPNEPLAIGRWRATPLQLIYVGIAGAILAVMLRLTQRPEHRMTLDRWRLEYAFVILVSLLLSPMLWGSRYFALTWPAWALLVQQWLRDERAGHVAWGARLVALAWVASLCMWTERLRAYSVHLWAAVFLAVWVGVAIARRAERPPTEAARPADEI